ncbi:unnamed protein product [Mucor circinelloides]|uniref:Uncharacterized protein n=1 Tax=Mucor circinelloides f. circinelloides (strain 1006PhL) TaxID=1220926 RepID=S2KJL0_MUCC1|nr:hypothetical protein HMPREF1544_00628 [Mucor circinelloides 1006PhL]
MDLQRAASMIRALPYMSKTIVDDTLYEKVLSFLTLVLSTHSIVAITELNKNCQIFHQIRKACLLVDEQDYRVTTLCLRFLGQLIHYGKDELFQELASDYADVLAMITAGIKSNEAALRCACIETCRLFLWCDSGYRWLLGNEKATSFIPFALLDQSSYVVAEACQLFAALLTLKSDELLQLMDPSELIRSILLQSAQGVGDQKQILSALDFCWAIVALKDRNTLPYIQSKQLLHSFMPSLLSCDRMVRARILEVINELFTWDPDPLLTLNLSSSGGNVHQAYLTVSELALNMIRESTALNDTMTAVSLLDASFTLLQQSSNTEACSSDAAYSTLHDLLHVCLDNDTHSRLQNVKKSLKSVRLKNNLLQLVMRTVNKLLETDAAIMNNPGFTDFFDVLKHDMLYSDSRVLKACLELLTSAMYKDQQPAILAQCTHALVKIMMNDDAALDCKSLSIVLASFDSLLGHSDIGALVTESGKGVAEALEFKFLDTEWDIRDATVNFIGQLFKDDPIRMTKVQFALTYDLPLQVFARIHDAEPYVRASAVQVLQMMMKCKEGWDYIQQHKVSRDLAATLPCLLYDTEAFVRRATLDAISCLIENRSSQGMLMETEDSKNQNSLNPHIIRDLVQDEDTDVRIRACKLIESLWLLYAHEKQQSKRDQQAHDHLFTHIKAGELLAEAAVDTNRVVRIEAVRVIESILSRYASAALSTGQKRPFDDKDPTDDDFIKTLQMVNLAQQKQTLDPEHLYQEAFDINADMMTQSIIPTNPEDDINMLDCY